MPQGLQMGIGTVMQGLVLAGVLWIGASIQELKTTVALNDYRIDQIEKKASL